MDLQDQQVRVDHLVHPGRVDLRAVQGRLEVLVHQGLEECLARQAKTALQDQRVLQVLGDQLVQLDHLVAQGHKDKQDLQGFLVNPVQEEIKEPPDQQDHLDQLVQLDQLDLAEMQDLMVS